MTARPDPEIWPPIGRLRAEVDRLRAEVDHLRRERRPRREEIHDPKLELPEALGLVVRRLRVRSHLSQGELADAANLSRRLVGLIERGRGNPTLTTLASVACALRQRPHQLVRDAETYPTRRAVAVGTYWEVAPTALDLRTAFGLALNGYRMFRWMRQDELARYAGMSPRYVSMLECGDANPTLEAMISLGDVLERNPHQFVRVAETFQEGRDVFRWRRSLGGSSWRYSSLRDYHDVIL